MFGAMTTTFTSTSHPFDDAFSLMRTMQADIKQLKAELQAEKARRTAEVGDLQREVRTLRSKVEQALRDLTSANDRVTSALTSETSLRARSLEMLRKEVADAIQLSSEVHHLKMIQGTHFGKLASELKTERHERQAGQQALDALLTAEVQTRTDEVGMLGKQVFQFRKLWEDNLRADRENYRLLLKDVHAAGQLLAGNVKAAGITLGVGNLSASMGTTASSNLMGRGTGVEQTKQVRVGIGS